MDEYGNLNTNQYGYEQQTEEFYQEEAKKYSQRINNEQTKNINDDSHYCPIHGFQGYREQIEREQNEMRIQGYKGREGEEQRMFDKEGVMHISGRDEENRYQYIHKNISKNQDTNIRKEYTNNENEEDIDNYKFYESKNITGKSSNMSTLKTQNINKLYHQGNKSGMMKGSQLVQMGLENQNEQIGQIKQLSQTGQGYEYSKLYIATKVIPVYSEVINQHFQTLNARDICNICGNPFGQNQFSSKVETFHNNCPIHGQTIMHQQYSGY